MKAESGILSALVAAAALVLGGCGASPTPQVEPSNVPVQQQKPVTPVGSGHGLCFDLNSDLARSAVARLAPPPIGDWSIGQASDDSVDAGCDGVLSWMTVNTDTNHPYTHVLFFTDGTYLGTATAEPYMYTMVTGETRDSVSLTYHWLTDTDPMCCPQGGPSVVTFTLDGTTVRANGEFPPHN
ncbi:LppP/LprE family lipoprotein [Nocardia sp. NPDC050406]|uniref:LppP/LprE family lipoprotein n=1 Tax=Nocardia sp. NPDC050406 TaxID=3364318 RepID=UPI0037B8819C